MWGWVKNLATALFESFFKRIDRTEKVKDAQSSGVEEGLRDGVHEHVKELREQRKSQQLE